MKNVDSFKEFLLKKKLEEVQNKVNWEDRKTNWIDSVSKLYIGLLYFANH